MVSVVIPTLNEEKYIGVLLNCLKNQTWKDFEVIVADAESSDDTIKIAKKFGAKIAGGGTIAVGRNNGAKKAKGEVLVFMDADISFDTSFVGNCYQSFVNQKLAMACCYFDTYPLPLKLKMIFTMWNSSKYLRRKTKTPDGEGQCMWVKREVFERLGGFNEKLKISEDADLIHRGVELELAYDILNYRFTPSTRRYEKVGVLRVFGGSLFAGIGQVMGIIRGHKFTEEIYGGWGKYDVQDLPQETGKKAKVFLPQK